MLGRPEAWDSSTELHRKQAVGAGCDESVGRAGVTKHKIMPQLEGA